MELLKKNMCSVDDERDLCRTIGIDKWCSTVYLFFASF